MENNQTKRLLLLSLFVGGFVLFVRGLPTVDQQQQQPQYVIEEILEEEVGENFDEDGALLRGGLNETEVTQTRVLYTGSQVWKVRIESSKQLKVLSELRKQKDISMWGGNATYIDILVKAKSVQKVAQKLKENNIQYELLISDVQKAIDEENPPVQEEEETDDRQAKRLPPKYLTAWRGLTALGNRLELWPAANWGHRLTWKAYHRLTDIHGYLDYLAETYPNLCQVETIGNSVEGRPLKLLRISSNPTSSNKSTKSVWVDGGIHAREWISPATVTFIINNFVLNYENEPQSVREIDWYFLPVVNPDGYEYSHVRDRLWRKNRARAGFCAGTDLNRNFGYRWGGKGSSKNPCQEIYGGSGPFSEPETAAIQRFITGKPGGNWKAYISFHSYGQYILFPWGYDRVVPPDYLDLQSVANKAVSAIQAAGGPQYTVGPAANTLYPAAGGSDDWAKGTARMKYAYTIELRDNGRYGFVLPAKFIEPTANEALAALRVIAEAAAAA